jgi:hypothetical protein
MHELEMHEVPFQIRHCVREICKCRFERL